MDVNASVRVLGIGYMFIRICHVQFRGLFTGLGMKQDVLYSIHDRAWSLVGRATPRCGRLSLQVRTLVVAEIILRDQIRGILSGWRKSVDICLASPCFT